LQEATHVLTDIPFDPDCGLLLERAHVAPGTQDADAFEQLILQARERAKPKAVYSESYIDSREGDTVVIDGVTFTSRALRRNMDKVERVFPYVATCGHELDHADIAVGDMLAQFWLDVIKAAALSAGLRYLNDQLDRQYALGKTATMNPGSGDVTVWPIEQQAALFGLFGDVEGFIGVKLTDSFLMIPNKSVSGIRFPTEVDFRSCQVCRREECPSRNAAFDAQMWEAIQHDC